MRLRRRALRRFGLAVGMAVLGALQSATRAANPVVVQNQAGFEGLEEATVIYFPGSNIFQDDPGNLPNFVDEGGGMFKTTLRNYQPTLGWWDGDRATTNTDRQRTEVKGIVGLGHQKVGQTFEYSFDFRTNPTFGGTGHFCHVFQLKATDGNDGPPLVTVSLYKNGSGVQGRIIQSSDGGGSTPRTWTFTPGDWYHFAVRITPCASTESTGVAQISINGDAFQGATNIPLYLNGSTDYRPKWGFYRGIGTDYGVPTGDSWVEHRAVTGYIGSTNVLTWKGAQNGATWNTNATANFLNGAADSVFNTLDQVNFDNSSANTSVNLSGAVLPGYVRVNSSQNYIFTGSGSITGGTLRKDGSGSLTLATSNSYPGLTDMRAGTLFVTGSVGNNSLVSITGGTLRAGSSSALGTTATNGTQINGGALDINGFNLSTEAIAAQGTGLGGAGAIVNAGAQQTSALTKVTLTGDTTIGGTGRWDLRGTGATLGTSGNAYNLTKTGSNQISLVGASVDSALGNININQGVLAFQTSTSSMGNPSKTVAIAPGAILGFLNTSSAMNKLCTLNGGTIWAESGTGSQNNFSGPITLTSGGGTVDAGGALTGGTLKPDAVLTLSGNISGSGNLTKNGPGLVTLSGANTYSGNTSINAGTVVLNQNFTTGAALNLASGASMKLASNALVLKSNALAITGSGSVDLANGAVIVNSSATPVAAIRALLQQGASGASWTGNGITSSSAASVAADVSNLHKTALGYSDASHLPFSSLNGVAINPTSLLVRYTLTGDANLDQIIDSADFAALATSFNQSSGDWFTGDFNYDGQVNALDFNLLASNYGAALPAPAALGALVPEPLCVGLLLPLLACRRRTRRVL